jgi:hypothetical protein
VAKDGGQDIKVAVAIEVIDGQVCCLTGDATIVRSAGEAE